MAEVPQPAADKPKPELITHVPGMPVPEAMPAVPVAGDRIPLDENSPQVEAFKRAAQRAADASRVSGAPIHPVLSQPSSTEQDPTDKQ